MLKLKDILLLIEAPDPVFKEYPFSGVDDILTPDKLADMHRNGKKLLPYLKKLLPAKFTKEELSEIESDFRSNFTTNKYIKLLYPDLKSEIEKLKKKHNLFGFRRAVKQMRIGNGVTIGDLCDIIFLDGEYNRVYKSRDIAQSRIIQKFDYKKEPNTPEENELLDAFVDWYDDEDRNVYTSSAEIFNKYRSNIEAMKNKFPKMFKPTKLGMPVYRGTKLSTTMFNKLKRTKLSSWVKYDDTYYKYKKPIDYSPKRKAQSWTESIESTEFFTKDYDFPCVLMTTTTDEFIMNKVSSYLIGHNDENETIHLGNTFSKPVYLLIDSEMLDKWKITK